MERTHGKYPFTLPQRSKPNKNSFNYRASPAQRWIAELPVGNIGETAKQLYQAIHEVNRLDIAWKDRLNFLEMVRESVAYVQDTMVRHLSNLSFPLPAKTQRIASLIQTLHSEMALGYKITIQDEAVQANFLTRDKAALRTTIHRAIKYLSQAIITSYRIYAPHPQGSWLDLHQLYHYAHDKGLHQDPVKDSLYPVMPESSIAKVYKQILLLALASPYALRQGEVEKVYHVLVRWTGHVQVIPYDHPQAGEALFVVHTDSDDAPDYQAFNHRNCNGQHCCLVDTRQLIPVLQHEYNEFSKSNQLEGLSHDLLFRLIYTWEQPPKRHFGRTDREDKIEVAIGLTSLHHMLAQEIGDDKMLSMRARYDSRVVQHAREIARDDIWNLFASQKTKQTYEDFINTIDTETSAPTASQINIQHWQLRNESAGGYRLAIEKEHSTRVRVGELVGLRGAQDGANWKVGVVRWLRQSTEAGLELGVQVIAPLAHPAMVKNENSSGRASEYQYALLLPGIPALEQPATLITPILLFQPGNDLLLHVPGEHLTLHLEESLQDSGSFMQFRYSPRQQAQASTPQTASKNDDLDDLWSQL